MNIKQIIIYTTAFCIILTNFMRFETMDDNMLIKLYTTTCKDDKCDSIIEYYNNNAINRMERATLIKLIGNNCRDNNKFECEIFNGYQNSLMINGIINLTYYILLALLFTTILCCKNTCDY